MIAKCRGVTASSMPPLAQCAAPDDTGLGHHRVWTHPDVIEAGARVRAAASAGGSASWVLPIFRTVGVECTE